MRAMPLRFASLKPNLLLTLLAFSIFIITLSLGACSKAPRGFDEFCPNDPFTESCPPSMGRCISNYPCVAYCVTHYPEGEGIPQSGMGSWCDDLGDDFDLAEFCQEFVDVEGCSEWCVSHPDRCDSSICGDGACTGGETAISCSEDCPANCGDGECTSDEHAANCSRDCSALCGDGYCTHTETHATCADECAEECGNGFCDIDLGESVTNCASDCPAQCGDDYCSHSENASSCPEDCSSACGDNACTHEEDASSCEEDCPSRCGDDACTGSETALSCFEDCPADCGDSFVTHDEDCEGVATTDCTTTCGSVGFHTCVECSWSAECNPPHEECNGEDDDCDGSEDEDFECIRDDVESCMTTCGTVGTHTCNDRCEWSELCVPPGESCNGFNDDCDAEIDEGCDCQTDWVVETLPPESSPYLSTKILGTDWNDILVARTDLATTDISHFDGERWIETSLGLEHSLNALWGSTADDVYAVGMSGTILHFDGTSWTSITSPTLENLHGLWGSSSSDIYAVGEAGTILHSDGTDWDVVALDPEFNHTDFYGVWGAAADEVYVVGSDSVVLIGENGGTWEEAHVTSLGIEFRAIWGRNSHDIFIVGRYELGGLAIVHNSVSGGSTWSSTTMMNAYGDRIDEVLLALWTTRDGEHPMEAFIVGTGGTVLRYSGDSGSVYNTDEWSWEPIGITEDITTVWGSSGNNIYLSSRSGTVYHRCGFDW